MAAPLQFFALGDIVVDEFIRLKDASVHCKLNSAECEICMRWGDKIPFEFAELVPAVGNASNAAVAAARLGLSSALRTYVGNDAYGVQCIEALAREGVDTQFVEKVKEARTNHHYVLWYESQRTILVKQNEYPYKFPTYLSPPKVFYFSSIREGAEAYRREMVSYLQKNPGIFFAFQPGVFEIRQGVTEIAPLYERANIIFCNKEEAERILGLPAGSDIKQLLDQIHALGPKIVVITDDVRGAYVRAEDGAYMQVPRYPDPRPPYEITGAGDAFASTTVAALALGQPLGEALLWGATNASAVLQAVGAQRGLLTRDQLEQNLKNPPSAFALQTM